MSGIARYAKPALAVALCATVTTPGPGPARASAARGQGFTTRVLLENEHVRVIENAYAPGAASPLHTHAHPRVVYVVEGGSLALEGPDGRATRVDVAAGTAVWRPPETHAVRNVGRTRVRTVEVEVKGSGG